MVDRLPGAHTVYKLRQVIEHLRHTAETLLPKTIADAAVVLTFVALYVEHLAARRLELPIRAVRQIIGREYTIVFAVFALGFPGSLLGDFLGGTILALVVNKQINYADPQRVTYLLQLASRVTDEQRAAIVTLLDR